MHAEFFELLRKDHQISLNLLEELKQAVGEKIHLREELFRKLNIEILPHARAEESVFFPALMENSETWDGVLKAIEEHHLIGILLDELNTSPKETAQWGAKIEVCAELSAIHYKGEEEVVFALAEKVLSEERIAGILAEFREEKERLRLSAAWLAGSL